MWGIAGGVMVYGAINVTVLLVEHGVWMYVAWLLSIMVDLAMCVGLWGDRVLDIYGRRDSWVTTLRWITAMMTLLLNTARPALQRDWVGVGIHTAGPLLLLLVAEGAGSIQRKLTEIISELEARAGADATSIDVAAVLAALDTARQETSRAVAARDIATVRAEAAFAALTLVPQQRSCDGERAPARRSPGPTPTTVSALPGAAVESTTIEVAGAETETVETRSHRDVQAPQDGSTVSRRAAETELATESETAIGPATETITQGDVSASSDGASAKQVMWRHWQSLCNAGQVPPCAAELDRVAGTHNYASKVLRDWRGAARITAEQFARAQAAGRRRRPGDVPRGAAA